MERRGIRRIGIGIVAALLLTAGAGSRGAEPAEQPGKSPEAGKPLAALKAAGEGRLADHRVGEPGRQPVKAGGGGHRPVAGTGRNEEPGARYRRVPPVRRGRLAQTAKDFGDFVRANPVKTDYALFAEFLGSPESGVAEVRGVIVSKQGQVVWQDRQTPDDADFKRGQAGLPDGLLPAAGRTFAAGVGPGGSRRARTLPEGKLAKRWQEKTGLPSDAEVAAMKERQEALRRPRDGGAAGLPGTCR